MKIKLRCAHILDRSGICIYILLTQFRWMDVLTSPSLLLILGLAEGISPPLSHPCTAIPLDNFLGSNEFARDFKQPGTGVTVTD